LREHRRIDEPPPSREKDVAGKLKVGAGRVDHDTVIHSVEQIAPDPDPGAPFHQDPLPHLGDRVVADPIIPARLVAILGGKEPDTDLPADDNVAVQLVLAAVLDGDAGSSGAYDGFFSTVLARIPSRTGSELSAWFSRKVFHSLKVDSNAL
jgi:hypothetical protein